MVAGGEALAIGDCLGKTVRATRFWGYQTAQKRGLISGSESIPEEVLYRGTKK